MADEEATGELMRFGARSSGFRSAAERSVTLLRIFLAASALILVGGGLTLAHLLGNSLRAQAISDRNASLSEYVDNVLRASMVNGDHVVVRRSLSRQLQGAVRRQRSIVSVKVWRRDGLLAWTNLAQRRIGKRFDLGDDLGEVLRSNRPHGSINGLSSTGEDAAEKRLGIDHLLEVYAPIESTDGSHAIGAYEIYANAASLEHSIAGRRRMSWLTISAVFLCLYAALALLVRGASSTLRNQTDMLRRRSRELANSYRRLEESSRETIETLNATVEAKDPYTGGHSVRVQQLATAIGRELRLPPQQLEALRFGALFHDIGKLGLPDAILLKAERLTDQELEIMKRHCEDGAEIVGHIARRRPSVPIIRHHHERWDGRGYPDGLAGDQIPIEATIVGLADAWDAMTSERPYAPARSLAEALSEVRRGRGSQFAPKVVDALLVIMAARPAEVSPAPSAELVEVGRAGG